MEGRKIHSAHTVMTQGMRLCSCFRSFPLAALLLIIAYHPLQAQVAVDFRSGRLALTTTDLTVPAGPVRLEIKRTLLSEKGRPGLLGTWWRLSIERRLIKEQNVVRMEGDVGSILFSREGKSSVYKNALGERLRIEENGRALWTKQDGTRETYDGEGRLIEIDYRNFNKVTFRYGPDKRLGRIEGPKQHFIKLFTDTKGRLLRAEASNGEQIDYQYGGDRLSQVRINGAEVFRYEYDTRDLLVRIEAPPTGAVEIAYDSQGRVVKRHFADGGMEQYGYSNAGNELSFTDPMGGVTKRQRSPDGTREEATNPLGYKTLIEYNALGLPILLTDAMGNQTQLGYDGQSRLTSLKDAASRITRFEYLKDTLFRSAIIKPDGTTQINRYDGQMNLTEVRLGNQVILQQTYYPDGSVKSSKEMGRPEERFSYDQAGRLSIHGNALGQQTLFEYDQRGRLIRKVNPLGGVTAYAYDNLNRLISETDPAGSAIRYEYNPQGLLSKMTDPQGKLRTFQYDTRGRLLNASDPSGGDDHHEYDALGRLTKRRYPDGQSSLFNYDSAGNLVGETHSMGQTRRLSRDPLGRIIREATADGLEVNYAYDALDNIISWKDSRGGGEGFSYHSSGKLVERRTLQGVTTRFGYDPAGNLISMTDPLGKVKRFAYTGAGELSETEEPDGSRAKYAYDPAGRLSTVRHPGGGESRFLYDPSGNHVGTKNPIGKATRSRYDPAGRLISHTDAKGQTIHYVYDLTGQLKEKRLPDGTKVLYRYDPSGRLLIADDGKFPLRFGYNETGRINRVEYPAINKAILYAYDDRGLLKTLGDTSDYQIAYQYNEFKQLAALVLPDARKILFSYTAGNRLSSINYPNGIVGRWDYDPSDRVIKIRYQDGKEHILAEWTYLYDPAGNLLEEKRHGDQASLFKYDPAGQIIEETGRDGKIQYRYAPGGNRIALEEKGTVYHYQYDKADRLIKTGEEELRYDENGNLTNRTTPTARAAYEYDAENRLIKAVRPDGEATAFGYAPTGERIWRRDSQGQTTYVYDGFNLIQELGKKGDPKTLYVHGPGMDRPLAMIRGGISYFYHPDRLGSIRLLTDDQGRVAAAYDYDAFGNVTVRKGSVPNPFTYTGREWEESLRLYYYRARYYSPSLGRFLSPDAMPPILSQPFSWNPYLYARNNPVRFTDPLGLAWGDPFVQAGWADSEEQSLEYWRLIRSRPDNPCHDQADRMIRQLEQKIRDQGRRVPPPRNPTPGSGGSTLDQGVNAPRSSDTVNASPGSSRPADPGASGPGATPASPTGPGGITRPGFYNVVGGVLGVVGGVVDLNACLDEGNSKAWCIGQLGLGVAGGVLIGGALAAAGVPATVMAVGGAVVAGAGALKSGSRWSQAPETKALNEQSAIRQKQTGERVSDALAALEGRLAALAPLGKAFCEAQLKVSQSAANAKSTAEMAKRNVESNLASLNAEVTGSFMNSCTQDQKKLVNLMPKIKQSEDWIDKAGKGYPEAIERLSRCASQKDIDDADDLLKGSTTLFASADKKVREAMADIEELKSSIPKLKDSVNKIRSKMEGLENSFLANKQAVDNLATNTETDAKAAEEIMARYSALKAELQQSASKVSILIPPKFEWDLKNLIARINQAALPCPNQIQSYVKTAKAAQDSLSGGSMSSLSGLASMLSAGPLVVQKMAIESSLNACGNLNPPSGKEADPAVEALWKLTRNMENWLKTIAESKALCLTKLYPKSQPPAIAKPSTPTAPQAPPPCSYTYSGWSPCRPDGIQSRSVVSSTPPGCQGTPDLTQTCTYKPPAPPPPPPKIITGEAFACNAHTIREGESTTCGWVLVYSDDTLEELTGKARWDPGTTIRGKAGDVITVTAIYMGMKRMATVKVVGRDGKGYDPRKDSGLSGKERPVDSAKLKKLTEEFGSGKAQGTRSALPQQPTETAIPTDYTKPTVKSGETSPKEPGRGQQTGTTVQPTSPKPPPAKTVKSCVVTEADREKLRKAIQSKYRDGPENNGPWSVAACKPLYSGCITWVSAVSKSINWKLKSACTKQELDKCWEMFNCLDKAVMAKDKDAAAKCSK